MGCITGEGLGMIVICMGILARCGGPESPCIPGTCVTSCNEAQSLMGAILRA
jgi:hypothetical protein